MTLSESALRIHLVGNAHIDPAWLWTYAEGRAEVLATYRAAVEFLHAESALIFTAGGSVTYTWVEQDDPELLNAIAALVREDRWCLVNGWWVQPDCNLPSVESFARHALYGQRTLERLFGKRATVGYNVDSFGHHAALPGLLNAAGLHAYVFSRPGAHENAAVPGDYFWWEGIDGSRVLTARLGAHYQGTPDKLPERIARAAAGAHADLPQVLCFFGVGNHGGGPTRADLAAIQHVQANTPQWKLEISSPDQFFDAIRSTADHLPQHVGELQHHARGCYSVIAEMKRLNRQAEIALTTAETVNAWAITQANVSHADLTDDWQTVLLHQFHATFGGTCLPEVYEDDVFPALRRVIQNAENTTQNALEILGSQISLPRQVGKHYLLVFNPLSFERKEAIHAVVPAAGWQMDFKGDFRPSSVIVEDHTGQRIASQVTALEHIGGTYRVHFTFVADVPPVGYRVFSVQIPQNAEAYQPSVHPLVQPLENEWLTAQIDPTTGWIVSFAAHGIELCRDAMGVPLVIDDPSDTWSHGVDSYQDVIGEFNAKGNVELVENGPVRQVVRVRSQWGDSTLIVHYTLYRALGRLDCDYEVDWHEQHKMLKLDFPTRVLADTVSAEIPGGVISRQADGTEQPCQQWVSLSGRTQNHVETGLSVLNDCLHSYDALPGRVRMTLLRSPIYAYHQPREMHPGVLYQYTDQGKQCFRLSLVPNANSLAQTTITRQALALNTPCQIVAIPRFQTDAQPDVPANIPGTELALKSWAESSPSTVIVTALKVAEDGSSDLIVRARETDGKATRAILRVGNREWHTDFRPFQIRTWRVPKHLAEGDPLEVSLLE